MQSNTRYRPLRFGVTQVDVQHAANGVCYVRAAQALGAHPDRLTDRLVLWAEKTPDHIWMAQRVRQSDGSTGAWKKMSYQSALQSARSIAQALRGLNLGPDRPVLILSENDLEHALLALGCLYAGIPHCSVSPAYSTISKDFGKLKHVVSTITPGLVFASRGADYSAAIQACLSPDVTVVLASGAIPGRETLAFSELLNTPTTAEVDAHHATIAPDSIAKFMFTSGSTNLPKAVIITQRMWAANLQQMNQAMPVLEEEDLVLVDWLPWNHTFGGNHNFGIVIYNGGTLYLDDGKPTAKGMAETLRNLREIAPTVYFNVPTGLESIANAMQTDAVLRKNLLSRLKMIFYAAAAMAQPIWDSLYAIAEQELGERIVITTGLGMTEGAPYCVGVNSAEVAAGHIGVPAPGLELKLAPVDGKLEIRYRGPNITPGYWRNAAATQGSRDAEGFYCSGDAVRWIDESNPHRGLLFDGRIAEDFKLATGTFVSVGPLRAKIIAAGTPYIQDVVLTGANMKELGALIFPSAACRALAQLPDGTALQTVLEHQSVQSHFQAVINQLATTATGSATHIARAHLMHTPASLDLGEITDKGSINQHAVLKHRAALVDALYSNQLPFTLKPQGNTL